MRLATSIRLCSAFMVLCIVAGITIADLYRFPASCTGTVSCVKGWQGTCNINVTTTYAACVAEDETSTNSCQVTNNAAYKGICTGKDQFNIDCSRYLYSSCWK